MRAMILALLLVAGSAAADPTTPAPAVVAPTASSMLGATDNKPVARSIWAAEPGDVELSLQSGLRCPPKIGDYSRSRIYAFDGLGLDIDCNYVAPGRDITLYLTRLNGADLQPIYDHAKTSLLQVGALQHPRLIDEGPRKDEGFDWKMALYAEDGGVRSSLWMTEVDGWMVQYRATYHGEDDAHMAADLSAISRQIRSTAVAHLDRCARLTAPTGTATLITDAQERSGEAMMYSIIASAGEMAPHDGKATLATPLTWCVDRAVDLRPYPMLLWYGVHDDGSDGLAVRVTPPSMGPPPALDIALDPMAGLVDAQNGKPAHWFATITGHGRTSIFAVYGGRPSGQEAAKLMADILNDKARSIGGFSVDGKTIILSTPSK